MEGLPLSSRKLTFGVFEVDLDEEALRRSGIRQKLGPQAFQLLRALLERPGQLVTYDELRQSLWPNTQYIDHQLGLKKCVNRIREVLGDSADHPCYIETVPRRGYRFLAPVEWVNEAEQPSTVIPADEMHARPAAIRPDRPTPSWLTVRRLLGTLFIVIALMAASIWRSKNEKAGLPAERQADPVVLPLISLAGEQSMPAFSPDSSRVAFAWRAPRPIDSGIYAVVVGTQSLLRLTQNGADHSPAWSPDGRQLAFLHEDGSRFYVEVVPALGGTPKTIYTGTLGPLSYLSTTVGLSFSPDGNWLAFSEWNAAIREFSIRLLSLQDSSTRFLTSPPNGYRDGAPTFSPGGKEVAFIRSTGPTLVDDLFVVSTASGEPRQLTFDHKRIFGPPVWSPKGDEIIFSSSRGGLEGLWRIPGSGGVPRQISGAGPFAQYPSTSSFSKELAYEHVDEEQNLWRIDLKDETHTRGPASILIPSANTYNLSPQFSPDGKNIAFQSSRSGHAQIWICNADGSNSAQVTALPGFAGTPRWSPDGRYLAFDYRPRQHSEIYVVEAGGVGLRSIAAFPDADNVIPSWSRDGKWVYFASNHSGGFQIWKVGVKDGAAISASAPVQVTKNGGYVAFESTDGTQLFYTKPAGSDIWAMRLDAGPERVIWHGPGPDYWSNWAVAENGIYFMAAQADSHPQIQFLDFKTKRISSLAKLEKPSFFGLTVSPDGRSLLYSQWDRNEHDILIIRNFR